MKIKDVISSSYIIKAFLDRPMPKWVVLLADLCVIAFCCITTFYFGSSSEVVHSPIDLPIVKAIIAFCVYAFLALVLGTSRYIIRLSVIEDTYRLLLLVAISTAILVGISVVSLFARQNVIFPFWDTFTLGVMIFSLMLVLRLSIKMLYMRLTSGVKQKTKVIMLGSAINSYYFATALRNEYEGQFEPVALLSLSSSVPKGVVGGIAVIDYDPEKIPEIFEKYHCDTLMFLSTQLEHMRSGVADVFLKNNIKLLMLNQVEEFDVNSKSQPSLSQHVKNIRIEDLLGREPIKTDSPALHTFIKDQTVMVTGAAGSIGSEIVRQVAQLGARDIVLLDQAETPMHDIQLELEDTYPNIRVHLYIGDVVNFDRMEHAFQKYHPRYVFHAAAYKHVPMMERNPSEAVLTNVFGTKNMADLAVKYGVEKFVMISTDKAVNPTNVMGASKRIAEIYVQSLFHYQRRYSDNPTTRFITTRFGNVLGSNGSVIPLFRRQIEAGGPVTITHRDIIRYFMTIPEACSLVLEAGVMGQGGEIYIFDMGQPVKIWDLANRMISLSGLRPGIDIEIKETGLRPGEKLYEELLNEREHTTATLHKKIMIARVRMYDYREVVEHLERLHACLDRCVSHDIVAEMKLMVPEYKSNNSKWQAVDTEINTDRQDHAMREVEMKA